jgi:hypothetical protein
LLELKTSEVWKLLVALALTRLPGIQFLVIMFDIKLNIIVINSAFVSAFIANGSCVVIAVPIVLTKKFF